VPRRLHGYQILRRTELLHGVCPNCQQANGEATSETPASSLPG
jgi:hypothetical protein